MCDAEKDWHECSFRASGAFGGRQKLPFNKPKISFCFFIFQSQLKMLMSAWTLERNLFHSKFPKNALNLRDECLLLPKNMTWLSFLVSFKKAPNYSTLNLTYIKGRDSWR